MQEIKASVYFYLFNIEKMQYDVKAILDNFCQFFDEVVVATIKDSEDLKLLEAQKEAFPNLKIVPTDISLDDNRFDGKFKTAAMNACSNKIRIIADADERFPLSKKEIWKKYYEFLAADQEADGIMVPVIDLWGSENLIRADKNVGLKFRIHKDSIVERGVVPEAELGEGFFDTSKSDSTEPLTADKSLGRFAYIVPQQFLIPIFSQNLNNYPYVLHDGYLDFKKRTEKLAPFWKEKWQQRSGKEENVELDIDSLKLYPTIEHLLDLK